MESYLAANREYLEGKVCLQGPDAVLDPDAQVADWAVLGPGARIEAHASIVRSVLWEGVRVKEGVRVEDSVVTAHRIVDHNLHKDVL
jgi:NDP-sugar pyrophosphorylase family protein